MLATSDGQIVAGRTILTGGAEGPRAVLNRIAGLLAGLSDSASAAPRAIGMGVPGLADIGLGITRFLPNLPTQWRDVSVASILSQAAGCPVYLLNDARSAALGESVYGAGKGVGSFLMVTVGTGIGGGLVLDGKLRLGNFGAAGEVGHQTLMPDGPLCTCGNRGCLETLASGPAITAEGLILMQSGLAPILRKLSEGDPAKVTPRLMAEAAAAGDERVATAIQRAANYLGIANVVTLLALDRVVLTGGAAALGTLLTGPILDAIRERVRMFPADDVRVVCSPLGDRAGVLGAVALAAQKSKR